MDDWSLSFMSLAVGAFNSTNVDDALVSAPVETGKDQKWGAKCDKTRICILSKDNSHLQ